MMRLGILGCGNIGRYVMRNLGREELKGFALARIADVVEKGETLRALSAQYGCPYTTDPGSLTGAGLDVVLEAANPAAATQYLPPLLRAGVHVLAMSVGAFADPVFLRTARQAARDGRSRLLLPTGAIAGLDYLKAAQLVGLREVEMLVTKAPRALVGAPYFTQHPRDLAALREPAVVFEGSAAEAIQGFPANVNVAVALSLASLGPEAVRVKVVCDPAATETRYEIRARGATGSLRIELCNLVSPENPRTSFQACVSALATLQRFSDPVQIGS